MWEGGFSQWEIPPPPPQGVGHVGAFPKYFPCRNKSPRFKTVCRLRGFCNFNFDSSGRRKLWENDFRGGICPPREWATLARCQTVIHIETISQPRFSLSTSWFPGYVLKVRGGEFRGRNFPGEEIVLPPLPGSGPRRLVFQMVFQIYTIPRTKKALGDFVVFGNLDFKSSGRRNSRKEVFMGGGGNCPIREWATLARFPNGLSY